MDALGGLVTNLPCLRIIVQKRNCSAQYVERHGVRPRQAAANGARRRGFTDFDRRALRAIVKSANGNAASIRADRCRAPLRVRGGGTSLAQFDRVSPTAS
jgi:hypothetical protein